MRRIGEPQTVRGSKARITIRPLQKLVAEAGPPRRSLTDRIVDRPEAAGPRVLTADEYRERVVEAQRRQQRAAGPRVKLPHGGEDGLRIVDDGLMKNRGQRRSRVLDVDIDVARPQRAVADQ